MTRFEEIINEVEKFSEEAAKYIKSLEWLDTESAYEDYADDPDLRLSSLFVFSEQPQGHNYWGTITNYLPEHLGWRF